MSSHRATTKDPVCLALTKALKIGASATPHSAPQPPTRGDQTLVAAAAMLREAMVRGALSAQQTRAQLGGNDTIQSSAAAATRADVEEEAG